MVCISIFFPFGEMDTVRPAVKFTVGLLCLLVILSRTELPGFTQMGRVWKPVAAFFIAMILSDLLAGTLFLSNIAYAIALAIIGALSGNAMKTGKKNVFVLFAFVFQLVALMAAIDYYWGTLLLFDNKAGYAALILLTIPIWWAAWNTKHKWQTIACYTILTADIAALFGFGLRGAWLAFSIAFLLTWIYYSKRHDFSKEKSVFIALAIVFGVIVLIYALYFLRPDSADGRMFIFLCAAKLGAQSPIFGWGTYAILAHYMPVQADVLAALPPDSAAAMLADNTFTAFNLPLDLFARYGILGVSCAGWLVFSLYKEVSRSTNRLNKAPFFALTAFLVLSLTSYPWFYPSVFALFVMFLGTGCAQKPCAPSKITKIGLLIAGFFFIAESIHMLHKETVWQEADNVVRKEMASEMKHRPELLYNQAAALNEKELYAASDSMLQQLSTVLCDYDTELLRGDNALWSKKAEKAEQHLKEAHRMIPSRFTPLYGLLQLYSESNVQRADTVALIIQQKVVKIPSQETSRIKAVASDWLKDRRVE